MAGMWTQGGRDGAVRAVLASVTVSASVIVSAALVAAPAAYGGAVGAGSRCGHARHGVTVPGAEHQTAACLPDLTTHALVGTPYTNQADWAGLHAAGTRNPTGVPGLQIDGYFPDSSHLNTTHGWNHDAQFVLRLPEHWNGGLVVTGAPGVRTQYSLDFLISDWVLAQGYAFAATDKGNSGVNFYTDQRRPGDAVAEWNAHVTQLTRAAKAAVARRYGHPPRRTYMTGISNGGYLTRWQLENHPELYDGGVDWEGTLFTTGGPNLLTSLPTAVAYSLGTAGHDQMFAAGFAPGSEFLWPYHQTVYWGLTQKIYRAAFDPDYDPTCPGPTLTGSTSEILAPCRSDASYDLAARPAAVHDALARVALTGKIGRPLITLHGTLDSLLPIATDSDVYTRMIAAAHRGRWHRYYRVEGGNHVDGLYDEFPTRLRPMLPCYRGAFNAMVAWVEHRVPPPPSGTVPEPASGDPVNDCQLAGGR
jgi:hypothetical protein